MTLVTWDENKKGNERLYSPIRRFLISSTNKIYSPNPTKIVDLVPKMTSNTTPSGTVIYSTNYLANYPYQVFNKSTSGIWSPANSNITNQYIGYTFSTAQIVNRYTIQFPQSTSMLYAAPKSWRLEASNDNTSWITLDTRENEVDWSSLEKRTFDIDNKDQYLSYRIYILANNGNASWVYISEIEFLQIINSSLTLLENPSEEAFSIYGVEKNVSLDMNELISSLNYVKYTNTALGSGKVFRQKIDTSKIPIKKVSIE